MEFTAARYLPGGPACYAAVLRALSPEVHQKVQDVTDRLTADSPDAYLALKSALLSRYLLSPLQKSYLLLEHPGLGSRTPMALYTDMQRLLPPEGDTLLNAMYLQRLPERLRGPLAERGHLSPLQLAEAAQAIYNSYPAAVVAALSTESPVMATWTVAAAAPPVPSGPPPSSTLQVAAAAQRPSRGPRRSSRSPSRRASTPYRRGGSPPEPSPSSGLCWYHYNFREKARRCTPPCKWSGNA